MKKLNERQLKYLNEFITDLEHKSNEQLLTSDQLSLRENNVLDRIEDRYMIDVNEIDVRKIRTLIDNHLLEVQEKNKNQIIKSEIKNELIQLLNAPIEFLTHVFFNSSNNYAMRNSSTESPPIFTDLSVNKSLDELQWIVTFTFNTPQTNQILVEAFVENVAISSSAILSKDGLTLMVSIDTQVDLAHKSIQVLSDENLQKLQLHFN